jgi:hypothetical protein
MVPLLKQIFGFQGERVAMAMTSAGAGQQYTAVKGQIEDTPSVIRTQIALNNTWQGQMRQMQSTLVDIEQAFGKYCHNLCLF